MPKRIVISGYYGFGNTGDEAVLAGMLATLRRLRIEAEVTVLSADPDRTVREHPGVRSVQRYRLAELVKVMRRADLVISGGGSLFQDVTSAISPHYYLFVLRLARLLRRRTMIYAQGVGPLVRDGVRRAVARAMNRTDLITVRDPDSKSLLEEIGVTKPIHLSADPSFVLEPDVREADRLLAERGLSRAALMGVSLRPWSGSGEWLAEAAEGVRLAAGRSGVKVICVPMQGPEDEPVCMAVKNAAMIRSDDPRVVKGLIARCGLVVGMRLHALIFAAGSGVPFVPIVYDPKVASFAGSVGLGPGVDVSGLSAEAVRDAVIDAWKRKSELAGMLVRNSRECVDLALESGRLAAQLLQL